MVADSRARAHRRRPRLSGRPPRRRSTAGVASAVEGVGGERLGETAVALSDGGEPRWVAVFSTDLDDVDDNVALIRRQILIAGAIALLAALGAG